MLNPADSRSAATDAIRDQARRIGFELVGIAPAGRPETLEHFGDWLDAGFDANMSYLARRRDAYQHPDRVLGNSASLIMLGMNYRAETEAAMGPSSHSTQATTTIPARIARYATGTLDYHDVIRERLAELAD
ncbi:MAG: QueG-associated DUF1730 domain-containing protein, partial [Planctomycetaceae bacterium]